MMSSIEKMYRFDLIYSQLWIIMMTWISNFYWNCQTFEKPPYPSPHRCKYSALFCCEKCCQLQPWMDILDIETSRYEHELESCTIWLNLFEIFKTIFYKNIHIWKTNKMSAAALVQAFNESYLAQIIKDRTTDRTSGLLLLLSCWSLSGRSSRPCPTGAERTSSRWTPSCCACWGHWCLGPHHPGPGWSRPCRPRPSWI